ncbi:MAG: hypothetical protein V8R80_02245 [Eubacterium sp.]
MKEYVISKKEAGQRMDKYLFKVLDQAPKSFVYKMLRKKNIVLNDKKAGGQEVLQEKDSIKIYFSDETFDKFASCTVREVPGKKKWFPILSTRMRISSFSINRRACCPRRLRERITLQTIW